MIQISINPGNIISGHIFSLPIIWKHEVLKNKAYERGCHEPVTLFYCIRHSSVTKFTTRFWRAFEDLHQILTSWSQRQANWRWVDVIDFYVVVHSHKQTFSFSSVFIWVLALGHTMPLESYWPSWWGNNVGSGLKLYIGITPKLPVRLRNSANC